MTTDVYVLGGHQTDFARNFSREGLDLADLMRETTQALLERCSIDASEIEVGHVGNFAAELFCGQGHLGGLLVEADPAFVGLPTGRHEAACASGSIAVLAAMADLEAGRYDVALVLGVEMMRHAPAAQAAARLGAAAWVPRETEGVAFVWPRVFSNLGDAYAERYGLDRRHLVAIAENNFANARRNPLAQTRRWELNDASFAERDDVNPVIAGRIRKHDCSQITDGGAAVILASARGAQRWARRRGVALDQLARISGWGHRTSRMTLADKLEASRDEPYLVPHVRQTIVDAFRRAAIPGVEGLDAIECHDCFTPTEYMAIDHFGLTEPGASWQAIEDGTIARGGRTPVNPSGGLIGLGHPVGASGVRMLADAARQVTGTAGETQVEGARRAATLNIGGSATTSVCLVVERAAA